VLHTGRAVLVLDDRQRASEAIELAKTFGDDKSSGFINAVLSKVKTTIEK
jgi:transcription termination factor NusB